MALSKPPQSLQNEDIHFDQVEHRRLVSILDSLTSSLSSFLLCASASLREHSLRSRRFDLLSLTLH
ncbi:MAG: hypothetical protein DMG05_30000 [Acidobacteria bacterium]|nr:MAG: hypothetical protein DMG05_30000 [Acidobacteriota bacterium]